MVWERVQPGALAHSAVAHMGSHLWTLGHCPCARIGWDHTSGPWATALVHGWDGPRRFAGGVVAQRVGPSVHESVCRGCTRRYTVYDMGESITVGGGEQQSAADAHAATLELRKVGEEGAHGSPTPLAAAVCLRSSPGMLLGGRG